MGFGNYRKGDLVIIFDIIFPNSLGNQRKELVQKLLPKRKQQLDYSNSGIKTYSIEECDTEYIEEEVYNNISQTEEVNPCPTQ